MKILILILALAFIFLVNCSDESENKDVLSRETRGTRRKTRISKKTRNNRGRGKKKQRRRKGRKSFARQSTNGTSTSCLTDAIVVMKRWKDVVANFHRQKTRIMRQAATASGKAGNMKVFQKVFEKLVSVGGGDKTNLSCSGSYSGGGAEQMKNLSMILEKCEMTINSSCHTAMPMPDQGLVDTCTKATDDFAKKATECMDMSLRSMNASCACWSSEEMRTLSTAVTGCKINETAAIAKGLKKCQDDFRKCRKYEDASIATISTCSVDTELVKMKAASLAQNKIAINSVTCWWCNYFGAVCPSGCVFKTVVTGKSYGYGYYGYYGWYYRQAQTCSGLIALVAELVKLASTWPMSHKIVAISDATVSSPDPTCTTTETATIKQQITLLEMESVKIDAMLNATQASLQAATGTTASASALAAATTVPSDSDAGGAGGAGAAGGAGGATTTTAAPATTPMLPATTTTVSTCDSGWTSHGQSCYKFVTTTKTWDDASSDCSCTNKARLVDIKTKAENDFIKKLTNGVSVWLGARDNMTEGTWTWSSDSSTLSSSVFNKWTGAKTPTTDYTKNCAELTTAGEWDDVKCSTLKGYVCKKPDKTQTALPTITCPVKQLCDAGWVSWGTSCYMMSASSTTKTFFNAENYCIANKARLADIRSKGEHEFIKTLTGGSASWLGGSDNATESNWRWTFDNSSISSVSFNKWTGSKTPTTDYSKNCLEMTSSFEWDDAKCSTAKHFVCKKPNSMQTALPVVTPVAICDAGWTQWGSSCYKLETTTKSWDDARTYCVCTESADLVDIQSKAEDGFLQVLTGGTAAIWIGATDDTMEELWQWSINNVTINHASTAYSYKNWKSTPSFDVTSNCAEKTTAGTWSDATCTTTKQYVCKKPDKNHAALAKTTSQTAGCKLTTKSVSKCDSGWTHQGTSCYKKITTAASFDGARRVCACTNAGDLVSIGDLTENRFVAKLAASTEIWLGGRDFVDEGTYTWTDGSSSALFASTSVWTGSALPTASPATLSDTNDWVYMTTAGKWSVTGASSSGSATTKQYICKKQDKDQLGPLKLPTPTYYGTSYGCGTCSGTDWGFAKDTYPSLDTGKCYKAVTATTNKAADAKTACATSPAGITSATLATITSPLENAVVLSYLTAAQSTAAALWIGATAGTATTGNWKWTTNGDTSQSTFPYSNWAATAGDGSIAAADPAFMYTDGTWKYLTDVASKYGSMCEGTATAATSG